MAVEVATLGGNTPTDPGTTLAAPGNPTGAGAAPRWISWDAVTDATQYVILADGVELSVAHAAAFLRPGRRDVHRHCPRRFRPLRAVPAVCRRGGYLAVSITGQPCAGPEQ